MKIAEFLQRLQDISNQLDALSRHDDELEQEIRNLSGGDRDILEGLNNLMHEATHEESHALDGHGMTLDCLVRFLSFKRLFPGIDEDLFIHILDPDAVTLETKKALLELGYDMRSALDLIESMRTAWHERFTARYSSVRETVRSDLRLPPGSRLNPR